jgi:hypothetical protein
LPGPTREPSLSVLLIVSLRGYADIFTNHNIMLPNEGIRSLP